jgi:predicted O-linked N-acetylglucosamine transferase (SPINDLY family)
MDTQAGSTAQFGHTITQAWHGRLDFAALLEQAAQLEADGAGHLAAVLYQTWLGRNASPYAHAAYFNYALALSNAGDLAGAESAYRKAIEIYPDFVQPRLNLGMLYERMGRIDNALEQWRWVAEHANPGLADQAPLVVMALNHLGRVLESHKQLADASRYLVRSLEINPQQSDALHHWVHLQQKQCVWPVYAELPGVSLHAMQQATSALAMLGISDDPQAQLEAAQRFVEKKVQSAVPHLAQRRNYGHRRLRIGYASSDFCLHPVSMLMAELFELHDRDRFEVYGYCWSPEDGSALRQRVIASMDHFRRIHDMGDLEAAQQIRADEIDILVDLQGQTSGARANLLAYRPAPIQITYLGLPATTGLPSIDYVIADRFLIPESAACWYSEKPLYLPDIYQVSDRKRTVGPRPSRADCGLPDDVFVFCSLNNSFKYTPEVFAVWMNILKRTPNSVLWLLADNPWAQANLCAAAQSHGVDAARLVFAGRVLPPDYLARYACADLFLDTFPFNAGTTANDALWMGLPLLTLCGRSFAARMAGALLSAADLPELICYDLQSYEEKAVALAHQPGECARLRAHLQTVRASGRLFDTDAFAKKLESALEGLVRAL